VLLDIVLEQVEVGIQNINSALDDALTLMSCPLHEVIVPEVNQHFVTVLGLAMEESQAIICQGNFDFLTRML
jgi:hypothetical protein